MSEESCAWRNVAGEVRLANFASPQPFAVHTFTIICTYLLVLHIYVYMWMNHNIDTLNISIFSLLIDSVLLRYIQVIYV